MAITGVGTLFRRWDSAGSSWVSIGEVNDISGPGMSRDTVDTTHLGTAGGYRTFIAGFRDPGTYTFTMNFNRTDYETLKADFESDTLQNYEVILPDPDNTSFEFEGLVTEIPLTIPPDDKVTVDVTIKISGPVDINSGAASAAP